MTTATAVASPVYNATLHETAYLEVIPTGRGVRVQRTESGRILNPFWTVWLQKLLFEKVDKRHAVIADIQGDYVNVSARMTKAGLIATIQCIGCNIEPLPVPPIIYRHDTTRPGYAIWDMDDLTDVTNQIRTCRLPGKSNVSSRGSYIVLKRDPRVIDPTIGILRLMVELHVALALHGS